MKSELSLRRIGYGRRARGTVARPENAKTRCCENGSVLSVYVPEAFNYRIVTPIDPESLLKGLVDERNKRG